MEIRKEYLQILIYINLFCGFTSRKVVFARGAHLNCEVRLTPRSSPVPDTLKLRKTETSQECCSVFSVFESTKSKFCS